MASLYSAGATPRFTPLGARDLSDTPILLGDETYPQHLPKFLLRTAKGGVKDMIVSGAEAMKFFGDETFDTTGKFYNHATRFALGSMGAGQRVMIQRIVPEGMGPRANIAVYLDVLKTKVPNYKRDSLGNFVLDATDSPIVDDKLPEVDGYKLKWITDYNTKEEPIQPGLLGPKEGTMTGVNIVVTDHPTETETVQVGTGEFHKVMRPTGNKIIEHRPTGRTHKEMIDTGKTREITETVLDTATVLDTISSPGTYDTARDTLFEGKIQPNQKIVINDDVKVAHSILLPLKAGKFKVTNDNDVIYIKKIPTWTDDGAETTVELPKDASIETIVEELNKVQAKAVEKGIAKFGDTGYEAVYPWNALEIGVNGELITTEGRLEYQILKGFGVWKHLKDVEAKIYGEKTVTRREPIYEEKDVMETEEVEVDEMAEVDEEITKPEVRPKKVYTKETVKSTMFPIFEVRAENPGAWYNNVGFSIASNYKSEFNYDLAKATKKVPYGLTIYTRKNEKNTSGTIFRSLDGQNEVEMVLHEYGVIDPLIEARCDLGHIFKTNWYNSTDANKALRPFDIGSFEFYGENYRSILKKLMAVELEGVDFNPRLFDVDSNYAATSDWYDFVGTTKEAIEDQFELLNPFTCRTSKTIKLQRIMISDDRPLLRDNLKEINMTANKPIFLQGGTDGDLSDEAYNKAFMLEMDKYADIDSDVQELAYNVESALWDSGFPLEVKKTMPKFISVRKDTFVVLSTHTEDGQKALPLNKAKAVGVALATMLRLYPESTFYNTSVTRGLIVLGAGKLKNDVTGVYVPASYELLIKTSKFAGGDNGKWVRNQLFDHGDRAIINSMVDIVPNFLPHSIKPTIWSGNMIYPQVYDRSSYFFPGLQTVYDSDQSALNSYFTVIAICTATKCAHKAWKKFSGAISYSDAEFKEAVEKFLNEELSGRFANIITATPECIITDADKQRGYSWQIVIKLGANIMKTVCTYTTEVYRMGEISA